MPQGVEVLKLLNESPAGVIIFMPLSRVPSLNDFAMEFKIDTREMFSVITPVTDTIDANLTGLLAAECSRLQQNGSNNFIVDLQHCTKLEQTAINDLIKMHEDCYSAEHSLVFTSVKGSIMSGLKENESDLLLNIAPKMEEAIDIVSMEVLERDLLKEE